MQRRSRWIRFHAEFVRRRQQPGAIAAKTTVIWQQDAEILIVHGAAGGVISKDYHSSSQFTRETS